MPAKIEWPGIHFPGGAANQSDKFIMVYKDKWSRWKPLEPPKLVTNDNSNDANDANEDTDTTTRPPHRRPLLTKDPNMENMDAGEETTTKLRKDESGGQEGTDRIDGTDGTDGSDTTDTTDTADNTDTTDTTDTVDTTDTADSETTSVKAAEDKGKDDYAFTELLPEESDVNDDKIRGDGEEEPDGRDSDAGALIPIDELNGRFAKVIESKVCYLVIKMNKALWTGDCIPVSQDQNNFPANIVAAVKNDDNDWYYFDKNSKFCKRRKNDFTDVCIQYYIQYIQCLTIFMSK